MRLDIVVCYSVLEYCFSNIRHYERENKARQILDEIERKRINLNDDLQVHYEAYFETERADLLEDYQQWLSNRVQYEDYVKLVDNDLSTADVDRIISDDYLRIVTNIAYRNEDKIVFSELLNDYDADLQNIGILQMNVDRILDRSEDNYYNSYRFPIIRKRTELGGSSAKLSAWLKRIIQTETEFEIIDGYIYQERENFKNCFLVHVPSGAKIKIDTFLDRIREADLINEFSSVDYRNWNVEVHLIPSKKEQHARNILTNNYFIHLEKGMRIFGRNGLTDQSDITIDHRDKITDTSMPPIRKKLL